jgi:hypothetical protein
MRSPYALGLSDSRNFYVVKNRFGHRAVSESEGKILALRVGLDICVIVLRNTYAFTVYKYLGVTCLCIKQNIYLVGNVLLQGNTV